MNFRMFNKMLGSEYNSEYISICENQIAYLTLSTILVMMSSLPMFFSNPAPKQERDPSQPLGDKMAGAPVLYMAFSTRNYL